MDYIGIDEVAKKWGISKRFVQVLCANGRIEGATRLDDSEECTEAY